jgi:hypothetical protein
MKLEGKEEGKEEVGEKDRRRGGREGEEGAGARGRREGGEGERLLPVQQARLAALADGQMHQLTLRYVHFFLLPSLPPSLPPSFPPSKLSTY